MSRPSKSQPSQAAMPERHCWGERSRRWRTSGARVAPGVLFGAVAAGESTMQLYNDSMMMRVDFGERRLKLRLRLRLRKGRGLAVRPGFEPGQKPPKGLVLPLHHRTSRSKLAFFGLNATQFCTRNQIPRR